MFKIFEKLGGEDAVLEILQRARPRISGKPLPNMPALRQWKSRRRIPSINVEILQLEAEQRGIEWSRDDFVSDTPVKSRSPSTQEGGAK